MMSDLKLGFRMLRYAHGVKSNLIGGILMTIAGLILQSVNILSGDIQSPGSIFLLMGAMFPIQLIFSLSMSNLVQASPAKKRMQTSVPAVMSGCCMLIMYLLHVLIVVIEAAIAPQTMPYYCTETVQMAFFAVIIMLYLSACYKYFFVTVILFFSVYTYMGCFCMYRFGEESMSLFRASWSSLLLAAVVGIAIIAVGCLLQYGISCLVYKVPMSKMAQAASLRKTL